MQVWALRERVQVTCVHGLLRSQSVKNIVCGGADEIIVASAWVYLSHATVVEVVPVPRDRVLRVSGVVPSTAPAEVIRDGVAVVE